MTIKPLIQGAVKIDGGYTEKRGFDETARVFSDDIHEEVKKNIHLLRIAHDRGSVPSGTGFVFKMSIEWDRVSVVRMSDKTAMAFEQAIREATKTLLEERRAVLGMRMNYDTATIMDALISPIQIAPHAGEKLPLYTEHIKFRFGSFTIYPSHDFKPARTIRIFTIDEDPIWIDVVDLPSVAELSGSLP